MWTSKMLARTAQGALASGLLLPFLATGCKSTSQAERAQSPPPPSLSGPVRPRPQPPAAALPAESLPAQAQPSLCPPLPPAAPANLPAAEVLPVISSQEPAEIAATGYTASPISSVQPAAPPAATAAPAAPAAPAASGETPKPRYYTLQKGDTLYGVARKFNVPSKTLISVNSIKDPNRILAGTKIRIP